MPDFKEMYLTLFRETTKAISALQRAQRQAEEMYISDDDIANRLMVINPDKKETGKQPPQK